MQVSKYFNLNGKIQVEKNELHETQILKLNITKSKLRLPWKPQWNFERTIALTCEWYKEYINKNNIEEFTNKQITTYLNEINK